MILKILTILISLQSLCITIGNIYNRKEAKFSELALIGTMLFVVIIMILKLCNVL